MPKLTENYGLKKPLGTDPIAITDLNENADIIDEALTPSIDDTLVPSTGSKSGRLATILGWFANRFKSITGKGNWYEAPSVNLETVKKHIGSIGISQHGRVTSSQSGFMSPADKQKLDNATSSATAGRLMMRDSTGRARIADPSNKQDIANKNYVDVKIADIAATITKVKVGTYTGDGENTQEITLGFKPNYILVYPSFGVQSSYFSAYTGAATPKQNAVINTSNAVSYAIEYDYHYVTVAVTNTGFKVSYCSSSSHAKTNMSGYVYTYLAIG